MPQATITLYPNLIILLHINRNKINTFYMGVRVNFRTNDGVAWRAAVV